MTDFFEYRIWKTIHPIDESLTRSVECLSWMYDFYFKQAGHQHPFKLSVYLIDRKKIAWHSDDPLFKEDIWVLYVLTDFEELKSDDPQIVCQKIHAVIFEAIRKFNDDIEGLNLEAIEAIHDRIETQNFRFREEWGKATNSPDGTKQAKIVLQEDLSDSGGFIELHEDGSAFYSVKLIPFGYQVIKGHLLFAEWQNDNSVIVKLNNFPYEHPDHWVIHTNGSSEFVCSRLNTDDPHHLFMLGEMYFNGDLIVPDRVKGRELISQAAEKGYAHAQRWLKRNASNSSNS